MNPLVILDVIGNILGVGRDWLKAKHERKKIELQAEVDIAKARAEATIKRIQEGDRQASEMDLLTVKDRGWKDEYLLLIVTIPLILAFIPKYVPVIKAGFAVLTTLPEWYMWILLGVYIDTFGFRRILRKTLEAYVNKRFGSN